MKHTMQEMSPTELEATCGGFFKEIGTVIDAILTAIGQGLKWAVAKGQELYAKYGYLFE